jgi:acyl-CoA thioesterase
MLSPKGIVDKMLEKDEFSHWLGIELLSLNVGHCVLKMQIRPEMMNGFSIAHGGITYSLADSALAFAANSKGQQAVSIETTISHLSKLKEGDVIIAEANEQHRNEKLGYYEVKIYIENKPDFLVALFKGIVYLSPKNWE